MPGNRETGSGELMEQAIDRWMRRALLAEHKLFTSGITTHTPADIFTDEEWLVRTLTHKDGSPVHIDQPNAARAAISIKG